MLKPAKKQKKNISYVPELVDGDLFFFVSKKIKQNIIDVCGSCYLFEFLLTANKKKIISLQFSQIKK